MHRNNELLVHINTLKRYKLLLWSLPLLSLAAGVVLAYFVISPKWDVTAILEVGQVANKPVELSANVVARMTHPSFTVNALKSFSGSPAEIDLARSEYNTLKVSQVKGAELLEVRLRSRSPDRANHLMQNAIASLQNIHSEMLEVTLERNIKQIQLLEKEIQNSTSELGLLRKKLTENHSWSNFDATLSATVLQNKTTDLREMIQKKMVLEEQISPTRTYTTRVIGDVSVSEEPVSPNKLLIIILALILGAGAAVAIAFAHNALTNDESEQIS